LMITCVSGITIRMSVSSVSEQGRATQGVKLIRVDEGDQIAAITKLDEEPVDELIDAELTETETNDVVILPTNTEIEETPASEDSEDLNESTDDETEIDESPSEEE
ncbi:MAG: DNA gyrase C-terminal beta-propeller domain-containing protein, partial [Ferruginibacter sp.]